MLAVFPPTIYTKLGSTFEFLKLIFEQNAMFEESVEERNQSSPISVNSTISEVFFTNATTEDFTVIYHNHHDSRYTFCCMLFSRVVSNGGKVEIQSPPAIYIQQNVLML